MLLPSCTQFWLTFHDKWGDMAIVTYGRLYPIHHIRMIFCWTTRAFSGLCHLLISSFKLLPLASHKIHRFEFLPHFWLTASAYLSKHFKTIKISLVEKQPQWDAQFCQNEAIKTFKKEPPVLTSFQNKLQLFRKQKFKLSTNNITSFMSSNKHYKFLLLHNEKIFMIS